MSSAGYGAAVHYDRVTQAWRLLLGEELHYGVFDSESDDLPRATERLTELMVDAAELEPELQLLDVGCGTGAQACRLARDHGVRVLGITTSRAGLEAAKARGVAEGVDGPVAFELRDGQATGLPDASFDRVWVLESSHLMRRRDRLVAECARVLRPGGRVVLCDIVLRRPMSLAEVRRLREPLALLREVFGDARMEPLEEYERLLGEQALIGDRSADLTAATRPTFAAWRANAERHRAEVVGLLGEDGWRRFYESCDVLESFWDDGTLGYGLVAGAKL